MFASMLRSNLLLGSILCALLGACGAQIDPQAAPEDFALDGMGYSSDVTATDASSPAPDASAALTPPGEENRFAPGGPIPDSSPSYSGNGSFVSTNTKYTGT